MKAMTRERYGEPADVLRIGDVETPEIGERGVLVRVRASSVNPADWYAVTGRPLIARPSTGLRRPKQVRVGTDFAGVVEAVGGGVTEWRAGDEVFGMKTGALAEYVLVQAQNLARKPADLTFEETASMPVAGCTALQALRDHGHVAEGMSVLVNGASGGVGSFAVQIAKAFGATVTAVCSTGKVETALELGADHVVDYTREDFTTGSRRYDLVIDNVSSRPFGRLRRVLSRDGVVVIVGGPKDNVLLGPIGKVVRARMGAIGRSQKTKFFVTRLNPLDYVALADLAESGAVKPVIDRTYVFDDAPAAFTYLGEGHARGKIAVTV